MKIESLTGPPNSRAGPFCRSTGTDNTATQMTVMLLVVVVVVVMRMMMRMIINP